MSDGNSGSIEKHYKVVATGSPDTDFEEHYESLEEVVAGLLIRLNVRGRALNNIHDGLIDGPRMRRGNVEVFEVTKTVETAERQIW